MAIDAIELHKINLKEFMQAIELCKGNVYITTPDGDKLNMKSKLCQMIGLARLVEGGIINEAKIVCDNPEDESFLFRFNLYGNKVLEEKAEKN